MPYRHTSFSLSTILETQQSIPEHRLLGSILSRALYDLAPETGHEDRRTAISWFKEKRTPDKEIVTSYEFIREELKIGYKVIKVIDFAVQEATAFEDYWLACQQMCKKPNIDEWLKSRNNVRAIGKKAHAPRINYRRRTYLPREAEVCAI